MTSQLTILQSEHSKGKSADKVGGATATVLDDFQLIYYTMHGQNNGTLVGLCFYQYAQLHSGPS